MRFFKPHFETCLNSPLLCQPLSSRFALHHLRTLENSFCTELFEDPLFRGYFAPTIVDVRTKKRFSCGPGDGEKLFDRTSRGKGRECPREMRTKSLRLRFCSSLTSGTHKAENLGVIIFLVLINLKFKTIKVSGFLTRNWFQRIHRHHEAH